MRKLEPSYVAGRDLKCTAALGNYLAVTPKAKHRVSRWPDNSTPWYIYKRKEKHIYIKTYIWMFIVTLFKIAQSENSTNVRQHMDG